LIEYLKNDGGIQKNTMEKNNGENLYMPSQNISHYMVLRGIHWGELNILSQIIDGKKIVINMNHQTWIH